MNILFVYTESGDWGAHKDLRWADCQIGNRVKREVLFWEGTQSIGCAHQRTSSIWSGSYTCLHTSYGNMELEQCSSTKVRHSLTIWKDYVLFCLHLLTCGGRGAVISSWCHLHTNNWKSCQWVPELKWNFSFFLSFHFHIQSDYFEHVQFLNKFSLIGFPITDWNISWSLFILIW